MILSPKLIGVIRLKTYWLDFDDVGLFIFIPLVHTHVIMTNFFFLHNKYAFSGRCVSFLIGSERCSVN